MRPAFLLLALVLSGCSLLTDNADPFDNPTLDVYEVRLDFLAETPEMNGQIGLAFIGSDVASPDGEDDRGGALRGPWALAGSESRFPTGSGSARGGLYGDGRTFQMHLFRGEVGADVEDEGVLYELNGVVEDGAMTGTWKRLGSYGEGALSGRRVRAATEFIQVP